MVPAPKRRIGDRWEVAARRYLEARGLRTLARNHQCRAGEVDLVMRDDDCLCFVEVRYRRGSGFGGAALSVDGHKQRRIATAARHFLMRKPAYRDWPCRFDVVSCSGARCEIEWLRDAFRLDDLAGGGVR